MKAHKVKILKYKMHARGKKSRCIDTRYTCRYKYNIDKDFLQAPECRQLIQRLKEASEGELIRILKDINTWYYGKVKIYINRSCFYNFGMCVSELDV